jgi:nitroreductase
MAEPWEEIKYGPAESGVEDLILKRWSPRAFADTPVSTRSLTRLFTAAAWAPSSFNEQPWRFLVGRKGDATYAKIFDVLADFNKTWAASAPVLILTAGCKVFAHNGQPNRFALHDTGAASAYLALQATALGLHAHGMGGFDKDKARVSFDIPDDFEIGAVWAVGTLGDPSTLPEGMQKMEQAARPRNPLREFVYAAWDEPAAL